eukprot:844793-Ditylum_brightwellii.AAC.1
MPNSVQRWDLSMSNSQKVLLSKSKESRSRAVRELRVCCFKMSKARACSCERCWQKAALTVFGLFLIAVLVL